MKKKLLVLVTALVMVLSCALGLAACGGKLEEGTYVSYMLTEIGEQKIATSAGSLGEWEFKDGNVTVAGQSGTYKVSGDTLTVTIGGQDQKFTKDGNMWKATDKGMTIALVKKGEKPDGYTVMETGL